MLRKIGFLCLALILTACQGSALVLFSPTPTALPEIFTKVVKVGPYQMSITCEGKGEPTIILENGLDYMSWSRYAPDRFMAIRRTCRYLRVGMEGQSIPGPRTTLDQVEDLHSLLKQAGIPGPYILVGHSIAGYNLVEYTSKYPRDVAGMVCVDCRYPALPPIFGKNLSSVHSTAADATLKVLNDQKGFPGEWILSLEHLDIEASDQEVLKITSLWNTPFIVMVGGTHHFFKDEQVNRIFEQSWLQTNQILSQLSTRGQIVTLPDDGHISILYSLKVEAAVRDVVAEATQGT